MTRALPVVLALALGCGPTTPGADAAVRDAEPDAHDAPISPRDVGRDVGRDAPPGDAWFLPLPDANEDAWYFRGSDANVRQGSCSASGLVSGPAREATRPVSPLSGARVSTVRPLLRWSLAAGVDEGHVELCADRACATVLTSIDGTASGATSTATAVTTWCSSRATPSW